MIFVDRHRDGRAVDFARRGVDDAGTFRLRRLKDVQRAFDVGVLTTEAILG